MDTDNDNMDEKEYTCFYCQSPLSYDLCLSGSHYCLQGSNSIEFWGNVVKKTSTKALEEEEQENDEDDVHDDDVVEDDSVVKTIKDLDHMGYADSKDFSSKSEDGKDDQDDKRSTQWKLQLIKLIKERPGLYNKKLPLNQRSFSARARLWREVHNALSIQLPVEELPKKFKILRDKFHREQKKIKEGTSTPDTWSLYKHLKFLSNPDNVKIPKAKLTDQDAKSGNDPTESEEEIGSILDLEEQLAELVGERPPLYDSNLPRNERAAHIKVRLWQEVHDTLNGAIPLVELPKRFKQLKDRYFKEKKKPYDSVWPLMKTLSYLSDSPKVSRSGEEKRKSISEMSLTPGLELRISSPLRNGFSTEESCYGQQFDDDESSHIQRLKRKFEDSLDNEDATSLKRIDYDTWDEDDFFGAYLVKLMKKIPIENKLTLHMDIMKMVHGVLAKSKV